MKGRLIALVIALVALVAPKSEAWNVINVPAGADLQAALDNAKPGDSIRLHAGATYVGHFVLRAKGASASLPIIIRSDASTGAFPTGRISPSYAKLMPKLKSPDTMPALTTDPGIAVSGYVLKFVELVANEKQGDVFTLGLDDTRQNLLSQVPHDFEIDRCYIHGTATSNSKRGISLNANKVKIHDSYFADFHAVAQDSQAIGAYNGIGNYTITNNYIEGAGENVMFGGDDPKIVGLVQRNITFTHNLVSRPMAWKGSSWQIKNLFELKNAENVLIEGNIFQNHWPQAQKGVAIVFTPRNQGNTAPQTVVGNVTFRYNIVRNVASAIEVLGKDNDAPSQQTHDININNNLISVCSKLLGGDGRFLNFDVGVDIGARNVHVTHNTVHNDGSSVLYVSGDKPWNGFVYEDNLSTHNTYGIMSDKGMGSGTLAFYFPLSSVLNNVLAGGNAKYYPVGNLFPIVTDFGLEFVDYAGGDYRLSSSSTYQSAGTDGKDIGADVSLVLSKTAGL